MINLFTRSRVELHWAEFISIGSVMTLGKVADPMTRRSTLATLGFFLGLLARGGAVLPEVFRQLSWAWNTPPGETVEWGEPFFRFLYLGLPGALIGMIVGLLLAAMWNGVSPNRRTADHHG
ncbi:MAG TPA: hypothetical protein VG713_05850 [Pirellulales bacterium]|nr:hypothetical protein [Pirellulales bacterium]